MCRLRQQTPPSPLHLRERQTGAERNVFLLRNWQLFFLPADGGNVDNTNVLPEWKWHKAGGGKGGGTCASFLPAHRSLLVSLISGRSEKKKRAAMQRKSNTGNRTLQLEGLFLFPVLQQASKIWTRTSVPTLSCGQQLELPVGGRSGSTARARRTVK